MITRIVLRRVRLPLVRPFRSRTDELRSRELIVVEARGDGVVGWGECAAQPTSAYEPETVDLAWAELRDTLAPALLRGRPLESQLAMATAAIEMAVLDTRLRSEGRSLAAHLGAVRSTVPAGAVVGLHDEPDSLRAEVAELVDEGYLRVKVKIERGRAHELASAARRAAGDLETTVDANEAFTLDDSDELRSLDELGLAHIEQPLARGDLAGHAALTGLLDTPICLDESLRGVADLEAAIGHGACSVACIKPGPVGGLAVTGAMAALARRRGVETWIGGMHETAIGRAANLALGATADFTLIGDFSATGRYFEHDLAEPVRLVDGTIAVPARDGLGIDVDVEYLDHLTVERLELDAENLRG